MILSLFVVGGALAFLAWLVFILAIDALPCFVAVTAGMAAHGAGAGALGAALVGLVAGVATLVLGQTVIASVRAPVVRLVVAAVFLGPAGIVGFTIVRDVALLSGATPGWGVAAGMAGAGATMAAALARLSAMPDGARASGRVAPRPAIAQRR